MQVRPITYASLDYEATLRLREEFLRKPLGLKLTEADVQEDATQHHFGIYDIEADAEPSADKLVGSAIGMPSNERGDAWIRLRQVVIHEAWRGKQLGKQLIAGVEKHLREQGFKNFELYAREESGAFYERCGYMPTGTKKELIGIEHLHFEKQSK